MSSGNIRVFANAALFFALLVSAYPVVAQNSGTQEFHHGFGGFSVTTGGPPDLQESVAYKLGQYSLWGDSLSWQYGNSILNVTFCFVSKKSGMVTNAERTSVLALWHASEIEGADRTKLKETPFPFNGFKGLETQNSGERLSVTRLFFVNSLIFEITLAAKEPSDLILGKPAFESFRLLDKTERSVAMIEQYAPPLIVQERPAQTPQPDSTILGLQGPVRRIRDRTILAGTKQLSNVQETHFDEQGFIILDVTFDSGYPDVVTSWGWVNGERVNIQSPLNYPAGEGPIGRSRMTAGGLFAPKMSGGARFVNEVTREFGNRFETRLDDRRRPIENRRYTNTGLLLYKELFTYDGGTRTVKTIDSAGGFIRSIREKLDANYNVLQRQILNDKGIVDSTTSYEYKFDAHGNWIERRMIGTGSPRPPGSGSPVVYRDIQYFETETRQMG